MSANGSANGAAAKVAGNSSGHPANGVRPGERRGGRHKGTPNQATSEFRVAARLHADDALRELARIMKHGVSETARIAACKEILDRGYGKSPQAVTGENGEGAQRLEVSWAGEDCGPFDKWLEDVLGTNDAVP